MPIVGRAVGVVLAVVISSQTPAPGESDWDWLDKIRTPALDTLMPMTSSPGLVAAYRTYRDLYHDAHERYFRISVDDGESAACDRLTAVVAVAGSRSVQQQLLVLHAANPRASLKSLLSKIALRRHELTVENCPALRSRMDALSGSDRNIIPDSLAADVDAKLSNDRLHRSRRQVVHYFACRAQGKEEQFCGVCTESSSESSA